MNPINQHLRTPNKPVILSVTQTIEITCPNIVILSAVFRGLMRKTQPMDLPYGEHL